MPRIQIDHVAVAYQRIQSYSMEQVLELTDSIFLHQPSLLGMFLCMPRFGVSYQKLDIALKILYISWEALREAKIELKAITDDDLEKAFAQVTNSLKDFENLKQDVQQKRMDSQLQAHPELHLLALVYGTLTRTHPIPIETEADKYLWLGVLASIEAIVQKISA